MSDSEGTIISSPLSPVEILSHIQKIGCHLTHGRKEDAHDFLRNVVDVIQSIWLEEAHASGSLAEVITLLGLTFDCYLRSKIKCMKCLGRSEQCDRMMDLTVEIDGISICLKWLSHNSPYLKHLLEMISITAAVRQIRKAE